MFCGDYYGIPHDNIGAVGPQLEGLLRLRRDVALGEQTDYLDDFNIIGWTRADDEAHPGSGCAVIFSDRPGGRKTMCVGAQFEGRTFVKLLGNCRAKWCWTKAAARPQCGRSGHPPGREGALVLLCRHAPCRGLCKILTGEWKSSRHIRLC